MAEHDHGHGHGAQSSPQTFSFSSPGSAADRREPQKNFVFIDEQNRHKRLKVVKACDGCRKRKIKCESANTNVWPCAACVRLKMQCIPPTFSTDKNDSFGQESEPLDTYALDPAMSAYTPTSQHEGQYTFQQPPPLPQPPVQFGDGMGLARVNSGDAPSNVSTSDSFAIGGIPHSTPYNPPYRSSASPEHTSVGADGVPKIRQESFSSVGLRSDVSDPDLLEQLGDLKISGIGSAPYLTNRNLAEQPAIQEDEIELPKSANLGSLVQIPEEMMPPDAQASQYFHYFFENVHPYVPVLYPPYLFRHWDENKSSISPLILEAIFSCSARMLNQTTESDRWLALAKRHEESFKDTPRLSTLQGLIILLKAREAMPTRGYYYRSWMSVVTMVAMAKDLNLHEHLEEHRDGGDCGSPKYECLVKSRVWHTLYVLELMIGGPQGRTEFAIQDDTIDFDCRYPQLENTDPEFHISHQYSPLMRSIQAVRATIHTHATLAKKKVAQPGLDPRYTDLDSLYKSWGDALPRHLRVYYPVDGSAPKLPFHFVANLHSYHNLSIIMHTRPQLMSTPDPLSETWRRPMLVSYSAAKRLCQLQESILQHFGLPGLLCMLRGINFTIYGILTCTMLHLVAVTHPHPDIHYEAADYFTRHMRILELCSSSWPMPQMERQILSLREAFSADINKPFELKPDFPGSPRQSNASSSPGGSDKTVTTPPYTIPADSEQPYIQQPPASSAHPDTYEYPTPDSLTPIGLDQTSFSSEAPQMPYLEPNFQWNPTPIIHNFEAIMGVPSSEPSNASQSPPQQSPSIDYLSTQLQHQQQHQQQLSQHPTQTQPHVQPDPRFAAYPQQQAVMPQYLPTSSYGLSSPPLPANSQQAYQPQQPVENYITPTMWHNAVATAYGAGSKRRWNDGSGGNYVKRAR